MKKSHYIFVILLGTLLINFCCDSTEVQFEYKKKKISGNFARVLQPAAGEIQLDIVWRLRFCVSEINVCYRKQCYSVKLDDVTDTSVQWGYRDELFEFYVV